MAVVFYTLGATFSKLVALESHGRVISMRVNIYAEELTERVEVVYKNVEGEGFIGLRFFLELPICIPGGSGHAVSHRGPFIKKSGDDDSSAVTFWASDGDKLRKLLARASAHLANYPARGETIAKQAGILHGQYEGQHDPQATNQR